MIIDSHAHYSHKLFEGDFPYLDLGQTDYCLSRGDRKEMLAAMHSRGIVVWIEPSTGLDRIEAQLTLAEKFGPFCRLALGVHPKQCSPAAWAEREKLRGLVMENHVVAIGETGLDYSLLPEEAEKECQKQWFVYQIQLAHQHQLPLILHIRDADEDALEILRQNRELLHGGVAHCFGGDYETAMALIDLGFALGIGGKLLHDTQGQALHDAVRRVPLSALLVETDAPYIRPDIGHLAQSGKQRKKVRNTSLILPAVLEKIAELRQVPREMVEEAIYQNTLRVFRIFPPQG